MSTLCFYRSHHFGHRRSAKLGQSGGERIENSQGNSRIIKFAVPICTAVAPATRNSITSSTVAMPPMPISGILTAFDT